MVAGLGFEPRQADPETAVLPLHHPADGGSVPMPNAESSPNPAIFEVVFALDIHMPHITLNQ